MSPCSLSEHGLFRVGPRRNLLSAVRYASACRHDAHSTSEERVNDDRQAEAYRTTVGRFASENFKHSRRSGPRSDITDNVGGVFAARLL
jgi:hypothetical protein